MSRPSLRERLRYWFDTVMSRGTIAQIGLLAIASLVLILVASAVVVGFGFYPVLPTSEGTPSFFEVLWDSLARALSSGSIREDEGWTYRAAMLVVTIGGLIVVAVLIGIVTTALESRVRQLRAGRSRVLETGHTVILGWSGKVVPIVSELCEAARGGARSSSSSAHGARRSSRRSCEQPSRNADVRGSSCGAASR